MTWHPGRMDGGAEQHQQGAARGASAIGTDGAFPDVLCALCGAPDVTRHSLTHGLTVWLCSRHRSREFLCARSGHDFAERLARVWSAAGALTRRRVAALRAHTRRVARAHACKGYPGSYAWRGLRAHAERLFAQGYVLADIYGALIEPLHSEAAAPPSRRTLRRWFAEARWLAEPTDDTPPEPGAPSGAPPVRTLLRRSFRQALHTPAGSDHRGPTRRGPPSSGSDPA